MLFKVETCLQISAISKGRLGPIKLNVCVYNPCGVGFQYIQFEFLFCNPFKLTYRAPKMGIKSKHNLVLRLT
jgi:hypothetical protein